MQKDNNKLRNANISALITESEKYTEQIRDLQWYIKGSYVILIVLIAGILFWSLDVDSAKNMINSYEEVCYEWETVESYKVIEFSHDYCGVCCNYEFPDSDDDWLACFESCINTKPYIEFYNESVCTGWILKKK